MKKIFIIIFVFTIFLLSSTDIKQLKNAISQAKGKNKISLELKLIKHYWQTNHDSLLKELNKTIWYARRNGHKVELADLYKLLGNFYFDNGKVKNSRYYYMQAINILKELNDYENIWYLYNALGNSFSSVGDLKTALENYLKALSYCKESKNSAIIQNNIGKIYLELNDYEKAMQYLKKAEKNCDNSDLKVKQIIFTNLGIAYNKLGNDKLSINYHFKSFKINKKINNLSGLSLNYNNIGNYYSKKREFGKAIEYYKKALELNKKRKSYDKMIYPLMNIANLYLDLKKMRLAKQYLNIALKTAEKSNDMNMKAILLKELSRIYKKNKNYDKALLFLEKYIVLNDSLQKINNKHELENLTLKYENLKKEKEIQRYKTLYYKQRLIKTYMFFSILFLILVVLFVAFYIKKMKKINKDLEEQIRKNRQIRKQLQDAKDNLEKIVAQRTRELFEKNKILNDEIVSKEKTLQTLKKYEFLVNNAQDLLVLINEKLGIELINQAFIKQLNLKIDLAAMKDFKSLWSKKEFEEIFKQQLKDAFSGRKIHFQAYLSVLKSGKKFYDVAFYPDRYDDNAKYVVVVARDISEYKRVEKQLAKAEKIAALGEMVAELAHEIKNPVTIIKSTSQLLKNNISKYDEKKIKKMLDIFLETTGRISDIFNKLNEFIKKEEFEMRKIELIEIISKSIELCKGECKGKNINIDFTHGNEKYFVMADENQIYKVFINLILNSIKAVKTGGKIQMNLFRDKDNIIFRISDNGCGIKNEDKEKIFNPFFTTFKNGMGVGLSIVYKILKLHNAKIEVDSVFGKGTTFTIIFRGYYE